MWRSTPCDVTIFSFFLAKNLGMCKATKHSSSASSKKRGKKGCICGLPLEEPLNWDSLHAASCGLRRMQTLVNSHWTEHSPGTLFLFWPFFHHICQPGFTRFDSARQPGAVWICISITTAGLKLFFKWWRARLVYWSKENTQPPLSTYWKTPPLIGWQMHSISSHIKNHCCIATILRYLVIKKLLLWKCLYVEVHLN